MSNIDYSAKHVSYPNARLSNRKSAAGNSGKKKLQLALNMAVIAAAFLFVTAAVLGVFP